MPISPVGKANKRAGSAGFTLVELLVVVTIIAILALGVGLTGGGVFARGNGSPQALGARFEQAVRVARDQALLGRRPVGLHPRTDGWIIAPADADGTWRSTAGSGASARGAVLRWMVSGQGHVPALARPGPLDQPAIVFRPDGGGSAFVMTAVQESRRVTCRFDGWGALTCG